MTPQLWVFAGPNGAGKSTIVDRYLAGRIPVVNPDNIARSMPIGTNEAARLISAGRLAVQERSALLTGRFTFGIETTLTGRSEIELMLAAKAARYKVNLVYVGVRDVHHSIGRVRVRVANGGHDVPVRDLLRRFDRSMANLLSAMAIADRTLLIDNSDERRRLVLSREGERIKFVTSRVPDWMPAL